MSASHPRRRKPSMPFFPGAWPNNIGQDDADGPQDSYLEPENSEMMPSGHASSHRWTFPTTLEQHQFEDVPRFEDVARLGSAPQVSVPPSPTSPANFESSAALLRASFSQESNLTDATDSEYVTTPESLHPASWLPMSSDSAHIHKNESSLHHDHLPQLQDSLSPSSIRPHDIIEQMNANTLPSDTQRVRRTSSTYLDPPLLNFVSNFPPLSLSALSLEFITSSESPHSDNPAVSSIPPRDPGDASHSSTIPAPGEIAASFDPVSDSNDACSANGPSTSSSSACSSYSLNTDSPVLPLEGSPGPSPAEQDNYSLQPASPTAVDLDAFAQAAQAAAFDSRSSLSLPTSFRSASELRAAAPTSVLTPTSESAITNLAPVIGACSSINRHEAECSYKDRCDCGFEDTYDSEKQEDKEQARRRTALLPNTLDVSKRSTPLRRRTSSSRVDVGHGPGSSSGIGTGKERPVKLLVLRKMRKLGGRIINLFTSKVGRAAVTGAARGESAFETTTTAVNAVEFQSEHPIPAPSTPRNARGPRLSLHFPTTSSPSTPPPKAARPESFLPKMEGESASRPLLSLPFAHIRARGPIEPPVQSHHDKGKGKDTQFESQPHNSIVRIPTQTAPPTKIQVSEVSDTEAKKARRFSLSSALSKQRLEAVRTAVVPHPPLPSFPRSATPQSEMREEMIEKTNERLVRPSSMIVGTASKQGWVEVSGARFKLHQPRESRSAITGGPSADVDEAVPRPSSSILPRSAPRTPSPSASPKHVPRHRHSVPVPPRLDGTLSQTPTREDKRFRRFSLSSAISKRAMRARSMIVSVGGRGDDCERTDSTAPATPPRNRRTRGSTFSTIMDGGIRFDMLTPGFGFSMPSPPRASLSESTHILARDFVRDRGQRLEDHLDVESELDSMSFAHSTLRNTSYSTIFDMDSSVGSQAQGLSQVNHARLSTAGGTLGGAFEVDSGTPLTKRLQLSPTASLGLGASLSGEEEDEQDAAEREEERGFMRALGLEFDEIARRARHE
ncbi:hypothetical protein AcW2_000944 [Taiwanofungus camphoratus]|nr:hypothetical protein AcW2_000944 [Antrodia cinnamomea]